jgi:hypothetical protein
MHNASPIYRIHIYGYPKNALVFVDVCSPWFFNGVSMGIPMENPSA